MAKKDVWMPLDIGAYLSDTMRLTTQQHGAYFLLLCDYWKNGPLPDDDVLLAGMTKVDLKEWKSRVGPVIRRFFYIGWDGLLHQKRADAEIERAGRISEIRRNAAMERHGVPTDTLAPDKQTDGKRDANAYAKPDAKAYANEMQNSPRAGRARGHALAPPTPRTLTSLAATGIQSPREGANGHELVRPTAENGLNGWENGREVVAGKMWDRVWQQIVEAAGIDPVRWLGTEIPARCWLREGIEPETIIGAITRCAARPGYVVPDRLTYFEKPVHEAHAKAAQ